MGTRPQSRQPDHEDKWSFARTIREVDKAKRPLPRVRLPNAKRHPKSPEEDIAETTDYGVNPARPTIGESGWMEGGYARPKSGFLWIRKGEQIFLGLRPASGAAAHQAQQGDSAGGRHPGGRLGHQR